MNRQNNDMIKQRIITATNYYSNYLNNSIMLINKLSMLLINKLSIKLINKLNMMLISNLNMVFPL